MVVISNWVGEYVYLRSDYPSEVTDKKGNTYQSVEHAFQAAKVDYVVEDDWDSDDEIKYLQSINTANSAREAKRIGGALTIDVDTWDRDRVGIMEELTRRKFQQHDNLAKMLLRTDGDDIVMRYRDAFWGDGGDGSGANNQGRILMKIRDELAAKYKRDATGKLLDTLAQHAAQQKAPPDYASVGMRPFLQPGMPTKPGIRGKSAGKPDVKVQSPTPQGKKPPIQLPPSTLHEPKLPKTAPASTASAVGDANVTSSAGYKDALGKICGDIDDL